MSEVYLIGTTKTREFPHWESPDGSVLLVNADCLQVLPTLSGIDCIVTNPPYGIGLGSHDGAKETRKGLIRRTGGYKDSPEHFESVVVPAVAKAIQVARRAMVFGVPPAIWQFPAPDVIGGIYITNACGRNRWGWSNMIHVLLYGTAPDLEKGARPTVLAMSHPGMHVTKEQNNAHPTAKPVAFMLWAVRLGARDRETVADPFMGSGTTGVACIRTERRFIGIEIERKYFDIAVERCKRELERFPLFEKTKPKQLELI